MVKTNKWGKLYQNETECLCSNQSPDLMYFGGYKKSGQEDNGIYCHCKICGGKIYYERKK